MVFFFAMLSRCELQHFSPRRANLGLAFLSFSLVWLLHENLTFLCPLCHLAFFSNSPIALLSNTSGNNWFLTSKAVTCAAEMVSLSSLRLGNNFQPYASLKSSFTNCFLVYFSHVNKRKCEGFFKVDRVGSTLPGCWTNKHDITFVETHLEPCLRCSCVIKYTCSF